MACQSPFCSTVDRRKEKEEKEKRNSVFPPPIKRNGKMAVVTHRERGGTLLFTPFLRCGSRHSSEKRRFLWGRRSCQGKREEKREGRRRANLRLPLWTIAQRGGGRGTRDSSSLSFPSPFSSFIAFNAEVRRDWTNLLRRMEETVSRSQKLNI